MQTKRETTEWRWFVNELRPLGPDQLFALGAILVATLLSTLDPLIVKWLIDSGLRQGAWSQIVVAASAFCALYVVRVALTNTGVYRISRWVHYRILRLRLRLFRKLHTMDAAFFDRHAAGDLSSRLEHETEEMVDAAAGMATTLLRIVVAVAASFAVMFVLNWRLALLIVPFACAVAALQRFYGPRLQDAARTGQSAIGDRAAFVAEAVGASIELQLNRAEHYVQRKYARVLLGSVRALLRQLKTEAHYTAVAVAAITFSSAALLLAGASEFFAGRLTIGSYIAFYTYVTRLFDPIAGAVDIHARLKRAGGSISRLAEIDAAPEERVRTPSGADAVPETVNSIVCESVSFAYPDHLPVLNDVDLQLARGERIALIGESGSGKSTLAKLLARIYDTESGTVWLNDGDIRRLPLRDLRRVVALVPSKPVLFRASILENVLLGAATVTPEELERLARIACFDGVLNRHEERWDRVLGSNGAGLSDGEKQRLGLLRALVRHPDVLILDEATSALDPETEAQLLDRVADDSRDRVVLIITHRLSAADWADRVVVLEGGRLRALSDERQRASLAL